MRYFNKKWPGILLWPLSLLYGLAMQARNFFYDHDLFKVTKVDCPVISVGNITVGGTGKTPTVAFLAYWFHSRGKKVCIISRGYGRRTTGTFVVSDGEKVYGSATQAGDEPFLLAHKLKGIPIVVDEDRVRGAQKAKAMFRPDLLILDDAFQHRRLYRDVDIVTLNGASPFFGNGFVLPAGPLREFKGNLQRADLFWINSSDNQIDTGSLPPKPVVRASYMPVKIIDALGQEHDPQLRDKSVVAFCGLGTPENFRRTLKRLRAKISAFVVFEDHHKYTQKNINNLKQLFIQTKADVILTTEKDWVKISQIVNKETIWQYLVVDIQPNDINEMAAIFSELLLVKSPNLTKSVSK